MIILKLGRKLLRTSSVAGILSCIYCFAPDENPYPENPWHDFMCEDFRERLVLYRDADPRSIETIVNRCEEECPTATEGESLRFCADIYCCLHTFQKCSYTGKEPDNFPKDSGYYDICMSHFKVESLRIPQ